MWFFDDRKTKVLQGSYVFELPKKEKEVGRIANNRESLLKRREREKRQGRYVHVMGPEGGPENRRIGVGAQVCTEGSEVVMWEHEEGVAMPGEILDR